VPFLTDDAEGVPPSDAPPAEQISKAISLQTEVMFDAAPLGKTFGQVLQDVSADALYRAGETVFAVFVGANPRNNLHLEDTFLSVDRFVEDGTTWEAVRSDSHPSTIYSWIRASTVLGTSTVNISWTIESNTPPGMYRIRYFGDAKALGGSISAFVGTSATFILTA